MGAEAIAPQFQFDRLAHHYAWLIDWVTKHGVRVPSRVGDTAEVLGMQLVLMEPEYCVVDREGFSSEFMRMEITQLLAGDYHDGLLRAITPRAADLISESTAYGPRVWPQLAQVEEELRTSPLSRRAVVYVGRDDDLKESNELDRKGEMPCTMTWQFLARGSWLHMIVSMRSWDLVWGLSYDVPSFVAVQLALAKALGLAPGTYVHLAGSAHVYDRHWKTERRNCEGEEGELRIPWLQHTMNDTKLFAKGILDESRRAMVTPTDIRRVK